jgi:NAD(P)-dependent dehydrogenase (short-subunit alcohol dehydrogenase family)
MEDYFGYKGLTCVVTGVSSGMGKAAAEMLLDLGAEVYGLDRNDSDLEGLKRFIQVDLVNPASIDTAFSQLPERIDKFFGIAGISGARNTFNEVFIVNFIANKYMTEKYVIDRLPDGPTGAIAYMSSQGGSGWKDNMAEYRDIAVCDKGWDECIRLLEAKCGEGGLPGYQMSKRAVTYYTKWLADKLGPREIRVNCVCPCNTITGLINEFRGFSGSYEASKAMWGSIAREATAYEMAAAIVFVSSEMAAMVSGCDFAVDGASRSTIDIGLKEDIMNGPSVGMSTEKFAKKSEEITS